MNEVNQHSVVHAATDMSSTQHGLGHAPTYIGVLSEDERRHEVPPHSRRLKDEKEDAEILVDDIRALFAVLGSLHVTGDGQVGAFSRPQRRTTQTQDN